MIILGHEARAYCATGEGGGVDNSCAPGAANDKTWMSGDESTATSWDSDQLKVRSPIKGGDKVASVRIENSGLVVSAMKTSGLGVDEVVSLGGGPVRGSHVTIRSDSENQISVGIIAPIDPSDPSQGVISSDVEIIRDEDEDGAFGIHYGTLFPMREVKIDGPGGTPYAVGDVSPDQLTRSQQNRVASILMERFAESVSVAEKSGFAYAEMFAVGTANDKSDKGYRLWPQFGFDAELSSVTVSSIPDEIALKAAGVPIPPPGSSRIPHATILKGLRATKVTRLTVQQLISTPEGDRWWNDNGHSISLRLDFKDKSSLGYKRFEKMKAKIAKLRERNKSRSLLDFYYDVVERRAFCPTGDGGGIDNSCGAESRSDDCGRDDSGRFGEKNQCQKDGAAGESASDKPSQKPRVEDDWSELIEDGLDVEYGDISSAVFQYTQNLSESGVAQALGSERYPEYKADLDRILGVKFPDGKIPVTRVDKYAGSGRKGDSTFASVSVTPTWGSGSAPERVQKFFVSFDDVLLAGNAAEGELIVKSSAIPKRHSRRSDDCGRDDSGRFGSGNDCASDDGSSSSSSSELPEETGEATISSASSTRIKSGKEWKKADDIVMYKGRNIPAKSLAKAESVSIVNGKLMAGALKDVGVSLDSAARMCAATQDGATIVASHGLLSDVEAYFDSPDDPPESHTAVTFFSKVDIAGVDNAVAVGATLALADDDTLVLSYGMLDVLPAAKDASPVAIAREMYRSVASSIGEAEKAGVSQVEMLAAGSGGAGDRFRGYRIWPRMGFDGVIPRGQITPTYTMMYGFFNSYGSSIPDSILSPRAIKEKKAGALTIQALYETPEGQDWWEKNGGAMEMTLSLDDKESPGMKRFSAMREKLSRRYLSVGDDEYLDWIDFEWRSLVAAGAVEFRDDCGRDESGRFGSGNDCASGDGETGSHDGRESWKESSGEFKWDSSSAGKSPVSNGDELKSVRIEDTKLLAAAIRGIGNVRDIDSVVAIAGGVRKGGEIQISCPNDRTIRVDSVLPVSPDGSDSLGTISIGVSIRRFAVASTKYPTGVFYSAMIPDEAAMAAMASSGNDKRVASIVMERMTESLSAAEKAGIALAETEAVGSSGSDLKGYRLWPAFGFDGEVPHDYDGLREFVERSIARREHEDDPPSWAVDLLEKIDNEEPVSLQQLISTRDGERWWSKNGSDLFMTFDFNDKGSLGYRRLKEMQARVKSLKERNEGRLLLASWFNVEFRDDCGRDESGRFGRGNDCASEDGPVESESKAGKKRNVDVMIGGGKRVAVMDQEAKDRASKDFKAHPKPDGSASGSTTDIWDRDFAVRKPGSNKISELSPAFPPDALRQSGQYVAHEAVGQYLSMRHEEERAKAGGTGPGSIIDLNDPEVGDRQIDYVADALAEDAVHAYEVLQVDPGFYSTDLKKTMDTMSRRHPELESDENSRFVFTALLAITSSGQGPDANLADADGLYRMWREHGTVVPSVYGGGSRDVTTSLRNLQSIIDSLGIDRTRRLLSGYAPASRVAKTFKSLAQKSGDKEWRERTGSSELNLPKPLQATGELKDEVVPMFSVFGPKIGSFYANLSGRHDFLTMDRWLMRSVGRVTGDLVTRSTPAQAKARAKAILDAIESGKWKKSYLFGTDSSHGITKESLVRSLKIQEKTGVIEENGAAFIWATAAERSHQKTKRPSGGGYGRHEDDVVHSLHQAGNSLFKSLVHEQQDPRTGTARSNIREVFRRVGDIVEKQTGRRPDVDEVQAALWQYEKRLWKHLGAKTNIEDNSLFSSAADGIASGRIPPRKYTPSDKRSEQAYDDGYDSHQFDEEQAVWTSDLVQSGVDIVELVRLISDDDEESRNFAALDFGASVSAFVGGVLEAFGVGSRAFCPTGEGGGLDNSCGSNEGSTETELSNAGVEYKSSPSPTKDAVDSVVRGVRLLKSLGEPVPKKITIGEPVMPNAAAEYDSESDSIIVSDKLDATPRAQYIKDKYFAGDADRPLESLLVHESSHAEHFDALQEILGSSESGAERWERMTGYPQYQQLMRDAKAEGKVFRPAAGLIESLAWSPEHRVSATAGELTVEQAIRIASTVSTYAASNPCEFVAEYRTGVLMGNTYSPEAAALYEDYGGPPIRSRKK